MRFARTGQTGRSCGVCVCVVLDVVAAAAAARTTATGVKEHVNEKAAPTAAGDDFPIVTADGVCVSVCMFVLTACAYVCIT